MKMVSEHLWCSAILQKRAGGEGGRRGRDRKKKKKDANTFVQIRIRIPHALWVRRKPLCVHTISTSRHAGIAYVLGCVHVYTGLCISLPSFFPASVMAPVQSKPLLDVCLKHEEVL